MLSKNWIHLGSLDHLEVWWVGSANGSGRCAKCLCLQLCTESRAWPLLGSKYNICILEHVCVLVPHVYFLLSYLYFMFTFHSKMWQGFVCFLLFSLRI